jgi:hypothetical protein
MRSRRQARRRRNMKYPKLEFSARPVSRGRGEPGWALTHQKTGKALPSPSVRLLRRVVFRAVTG